MPVKLTVSFILIMVCVSTVSDIVPDARDGILIEDIESQADALRKFVSGMYYANSGESKTVYMSIPSGGYLAIGGDGPDAYRIRVVVDDVVRSMVFLDRPAIAVHETVMLSGDCTVTLTRTDDGVEVRT
jgi:hypothetical protein